MDCQTVAILAVLAVILFAWMEIPTQSVSFGRISGVNFSRIFRAHRQGSGTVTHYTMLELPDRFKLMNLAFDQEDYRVDKNLEVI